MSRHNSFVRHMCVLIIISGHLEADLIEKGDIKSGTIQETLVNVTMSIISQLSVSCYPEVEAIFISTESGLITSVAHYI